MHESTPRPAVKRISVIVCERNGDCTIQDYFSDGEVYDRGTYSKAVAQYLAPNAEVREVSSSTRPQHAAPTPDMLDRILAGEPDPESP